MLNAAFLYDEINRSKEIDFIPPIDGGQTECGFALDYLWPYQFALVHDFFVVKQGAYV